MVINRVALEIPGANSTALFRKFGGMLPDDGSGVDLPSLGRCLWLRCATVTVCAAYASEM